MAAYHAPAISGLLQSRSRQLVRPFWGWHYGHFRFCDKLQERWVRESHSVLIANAYCFQSNVLSTIRHLYAMKRQYAACSQMSLLNRHTAFHQVCLWSAKAKNVLKGQYTESCFMYFFEKSGILLSIKWHSMLPAQVFGPANINLCDQLIEFYWSSKGIVLSIKYTSISSH